MQYPYATKSAPRVGTGFGGLPNKAIGEAVSVTDGYPFKVKNIVTVAYASTETGSKSLGFIPSDHRKLAAIVSFNNIGYSAAILGQNEFFLGGTYEDGFRPVIRTSTEATDYRIQFGVNATGNVTVTTNNASYTTAITIIEYDFVYSNFEVPVLGTVINNTTVALSTPITDPKKAILVAYPTDLSTKLVPCQHFPKRFSSNVSMVALPYGGGVTGFSATLEDALTIRYGNWAAAPGATSFQFFVYNLN